MRLRDISLGQSTPNMLNQPYLQHVSTTCCQVWVSLSEDLDCVELFSGVAAVCRGFSALTMIMFNCGRCSP